MLLTLHSILNVCCNDIATLVRSFSKAAYLNLPHSTLMWADSTRKSERLGNPSTLALAQTLGTVLHIHSSGIRRILPLQKNRCPKAEWFSTCWILVSNSMPPICMRNPWRWCPILQYELETPSPPTRWQPSFYLSSYAHQATFPYSYLECRLLICLSTRTRQPQQLGRHQSTIEVHLLLQGFHNTKRNCQTLISW